jgi:hypothetical protein
MNIDVIEYLGKVNEGVIVLISINYNDKYYESTFFYKENLVALTPEENFEKEIGCQVEDWENYNNLVMMIIKKIVPYEQIINRMDEIEI